MGGPSMDCWGYAEYKHTQGATNPKIQFGNTVGNRNAGITTFGMHVDHGGNP